MAQSQESMVIGPFTIGAWLFDCNQLKSRVKLRKNRPGFKFTITIGKTVKDVLANGLSILPGGIGKKIGETVSKAAPEFFGTILVLTDAEPVKQICDAKTKKTDCWLGLHCVGADAWQG